MTLTPISCPQCGAVVDAGTGRCLCPPVRPDTKTGSPDLLAKAESLFGSYLAARVVHARRRAREAKVAFLRDPRNREKSDAMRHAEREVELLEVQLVEQTRKAQHLRDGAQNAARPPAAPLPSIEPASGFARVPSTQTTANRTDPGERECPRCAARVPGAVAECRCGYSFTIPKTGAEPLLPSDEEVLALRRGGSK